MTPSTGLLEKRLGGEAGALLANYTYDTAGRDWTGAPHPHARGVSRGHLHLDYDDGDGRLTGETHNLSSLGLGSYALAYTYNSADQVKTTTYPDGEVVTAQYDKLQPSSLVSSLGTSYVYSATYDALSRLTDLALGNGLQETYSYYDLEEQGGRLHTLQVGTVC